MQANILHLLLPQMVHMHAFVRMTALLNPSMAKFGGVSGEEAGEASTVTCGPRPIIPSVSCRSIPAFDSHAKVSYLAAQESGTPRSTIQPRRHMTLVKHAPMPNGLVNKA